MLCGRICGAQSLSQNSLSQGTFDISGVLFSKSQGHQLIGGAFTGVKEGAITGKATQSFVCDFQNVVSRWGIPTVFVDRQIGASDVSLRRFRVGFT